VKVSRVVVLRARSSIHMSLDFRSESSAWQNLH
jgi:hypothetical protein